MAGHGTADKQQRAQQGSRRSTPSAPPISLPLPLPFHPPTAAAHALSHGPPSRLILRLRSASEPLSPPIAIGAAS